MNSKMLNILACAFVLVATTGCLSAALSGVGAVGYAAAQERSMGDAVDDTAIHARLKAILWDRKISGLFDGVEIEVIEGKVLLSGKVLKPEDRIQAVKLAWTVRGVKEVINEIQIGDKSSLKDYAKDAWITSQVNSKLLFAKDVRSINYSVDTFRNVVYLMGIAQNESERRRVIKLAGSVKGVKKVVSHVYLKDDTSRK